MKKFQIVSTILLALIIASIAWGLHLRAVERLPIDYDEDDYLGAAQRYAAALRERDLQTIIDYEFNYEHPPLTKLVNGLVISGLPPAPLIEEKPPAAPQAASLPEPHFEYARKTSAIFGTIEVFALALLNPLSGLLLAIHTWQIKYTSQIMLEPLPALTSLLVVLFYHRARKGGLFEPQASKTAYVWMGLSAIALGITAAAKYTYAIVGIVILIDLAMDHRSKKMTLPKSGKRGESKSGFGKRYVLMIIGWGLLAVLIFWAFNPRLWSDPLGRLSQSIFYHGDYASSEQVERAGFPTWQQLVWLAGPVPWHPNVFLVTLDLYILIFAIVGFKHFWRRYRVFALWLVVAGLFLLVWPTKWPQYLLTITAPLCMSSAEGLRSAVWEPLRRQVRQRKFKKILSSLRYGGEVFNRYSIRELRKAWPWLLPGVITLSLIALYPLIYQGAMSFTDFNTISIRDGIQGGVWREFWLGITGQTEALDVDMWQYFDRFRRPTSPDVHFIGRKLLDSVFVGGIPQLLVFNIIWTVLSILLQAALGIAVALLLSRDGLRLRNFWRTLFILPWAIPEFVGALIWLRLLDPERGWLAVIDNFPFQSLLAGLGSDPDKTLILLLLAATWYGFPFIMLAATAGLKLVPKDVYEVAAMDGANRWELFRYVTWPLLLPLVMPALLIRSIFAFNQFYLFYTMYINPPTITFATLSFFAFSPTFGGQFAISAAINIFTVIVLMVLILWFNRISRAAEGVTYA